MRRDDLALKLAAATDIGAAATTGEGAVRTDVTGVGAILDDESGRCSSARFADAAADPNELLEELDRAL